MIKITNPLYPSDEQWMMTVHGVRNPYASWDKSDSEWFRYEVNDYDVIKNYRLGEKDLALMSKLAKAGDDHGKFMRMLPVISTITAPFYWWKEMDQYKVGTVTDSCSTMHNLLDKPFEAEDFSFDDGVNSGFEIISLSTMDALNNLRDQYLSTSDPAVRKIIWRAIVQSLPCGYNQKRTWFGNYQVLRHIYHARKDHKLQEWHEFCDWIERIPHAKELIVGEP